MFLCAGAFVSLSGCVPAPLVKGGAPPVVVRPQMPGTYHRVARGETLWRISRMYNVDLEELARINRITDATNIEIGRQIFIPNRSRPQASASSQFSKDFIWPLKGRVISSFGQTQYNMINKGINIEPRSSSSVVASRAGRVVFYAERFGAYGKTLIIDHGDGFSTVYARNAEVYVNPGVNVTRGQSIARAGSAGRQGRHAYLHFEIRKSSIPQNPSFYLPRVR
jgi:LysM repeat protein